MELNLLKTQLRKSQTKRTMTRSLDLDRETINEQERTAEFSVSSEYPVERWFGFEILDHNPSSIRLGRFKDGAAHRDTHYGDQIGVIESVWIDQQERKLRIRVKYSKSARGSEVFQDVIDGIRRNVSIRYEIHELVLEKEVDGVSYYRIIDWEPIHSSEEPDGADPSVGHGRSDEFPDTVIPLQIDGAKSIEDQINEFNSKNERKLKIILTQTRSTNKMTPEEKEAMEKAQREAIETAERTAEQRAHDRLADIYAMVDDFQPNLPGINLREKAQEFIKDKTKAATDFFREVIKPSLKSPEALRTPVTQIDMSDADKKSYSLRKVILAVSSGNYDDLGVEREAHIALAKKLNKPERSKSILVPYDIQTRQLPKFDLSKLPANLRDFFVRDLIVGTPEGGGYTVKEQYIPQSFIEILTNLFGPENLGVTMLDGLQGNVPMIRELNENVAYWAGEGTGPDPSDVLFSRDEMKPKKVGALTGYSHEFLNQTSLPVEAFVNRKLGRTVRNKIFEGLLYGTGSNYQPKGIKNWTGIGGVLGASFTRDKALDLESQILDADAADLGVIKWLSRGSVRNALKKKPEITGSSVPIWLVSNANKMLDYDYLISSKVAAGDLFGGIWSTIILAMWSVLEITPNPYGSGFAAGDIVVRALTDVDTYLEYPEAMTYTEGVN